MDAVRRIASLLPAPCFLVTIAMIARDWTTLISILLLTGLVKGWVREYVDEGKLEPPKR